MDKRNTRTLEGPQHWLDLYGDELYRYALLQLHDASQSEDMVQDTLLAAFQSREKYAGTASVLTWLTGILKHKIIDHIRKQIRESPQDDIGEHLDDTAPGAALDALFDSRGDWIIRPRDWGDPVKCLEQERFWTIMHLCLGRLNTRQATVFNLKEMSGLSNEEICKELAITTTNCWVLLYRARMGLRQCLEASGFAGSHG